MQLEQHGYQTGLLGLQIKDSVVEQEGTRKVRDEERCLLAAVLAESSSQSSSCRALQPAAGLALETCCPLRLCLSAILCEHSYLTASILLDSIQVYLLSIDNADSCICVQVRARPREHHAPLPPAGQQGPVPPPLRATRWEAVPSCPFLVFRKDPGCQINSASARCDSIHAQKS